jgi:NMD protein affecting ribosome stability and mRNA decay
MRCPACGTSLDGTAHHGTFVKDGKPVEHLMCGSCFSEANGSEAGLQAVARRCALALMETGGSA